MAAAVARQSHLDADLGKHPKLIEGEAPVIEDATNRSDSDTTSGASSAICTGRAEEGSFSWSSSPHSAAEGESEGEHGGGCSEDATPARPGALTPAILNLLLVKPGQQPAFGEHGAGGSGGAAAAADVAAVDELSAELHHPTLQALHAPQLHALSKESLDVLRAERIARRMERAQTPEVAEATDRRHVRLVATPVNEVSFNIDGGSGAHAKKGKPKSARSTRVYMPLSPPKVTTQRAAAGEPPLLRAECEPAPAAGLD